MVSCELFCKISLVFTWQPIFVFFPILIILYILVFLFCPWMSEFYNLHDLGCLVLQLLSVTNINLPIHTQYEYTTFSGFFIDCLNIFHLVIFEMLCIVIDYDCILSFFISEVLLFRLHTLMSVRWIFFPILICFTTYSVFDSILIITYMYSIHEMI